MLLITFREDTTASEVERTGRAGVLSASAPAWYRLELTIPESAEKKRVLIELDGAMSDSSVFIHGIHVAR